MVSRVGSNGDVHAMFGLHAGQILPPVSGGVPLVDWHPPIIEPVPATEIAGLRVRVPVEDWLVFTHFEPLNQRETLSHVLDVVKNAMAAYRRHGGPRPVVVFDLDDTLFQSNRPRTGRILGEWIKESAGKVGADILDTLSKAVPGCLHYSIRDTFAAAGLDMNAEPVKAAFAAFEKVWTERFFSNDYVMHDVVQPGAVEFAKLIHATGANIAYLTGRDEPRMGEGTRRALTLSGLPDLSSRVRLLLKPDKSIPDTDFKRDAAVQLAAFGKVVATFDNSPGNIVVLKDNYPTAANVFVDTVYDKGPYELRAGLYRVANFTQA